MIDEERLRSLERDFGAGELNQILAIFLEEAGAAIEALGDSGTDPGVTRARLHFIKGCARTIGADRLGDLCERLEGEARFGPEERACLQRAFTALRAALDRRRLRKAG